MPHAVREDAGPFPMVKTMRSSALRMWPASAFRWSSRYGNPTLQKRATAPPVAHLPPNIPPISTANVYSRVYSSRRTALTEVATRSRTEIWSRGGTALASVVVQLWATAAFDAEKPRGTGFCGSPSGIRTRVTAVRGQRPRPLDDGAVDAPGHGLEPR